MNYKDRIIENRRFGLNAAVAVFLTAAVCLAPLMPAYAQFRRGGMKLGSSFNKAARALNKETIISTRLARVSATRLVAPTTSRSFGRVATQSTMTNVGSALKTIGSKHAGSISVSVGSFGRKPAVSALANNSLLKTSSIKTGTSTSAKMSQTSVIQEGDKLKKLLSEATSPQEREKIGGALLANQLNAATARTRSLQLQFMENSRKLAAANPIKLPFHKNSNKYFGPTHVYVIIKPDGRIHKIGESAVGVKNGKSIRAESQVRKLNRQNEDLEGVYRSRIIKNTITKEEARHFERQLILAYRKKHGANALPGNLGNR